MTLQLIEHKVLSSAAASIEFTNIPQDGTDLLLVYSLRVSNTGVPGDTLITFNNNTSGYTNRYLFGDGSSPASGSAYGNFIGITTTGSSTANTFGNGSVYIANYTGSQNKSFSADAVSENNATTAFQVLSAGLWSNSSAISSVTIFVANSYNLVQHSSATLYKITKGSDGVTSVT